jgi:DNA-binding NtrC family response regulator
MIFFTDDALDALMQMKWTGNIRELRNVVERLTILCDGQITAADVVKFAQPLVK